MLMTGGQGLLQKALQTCPAGRHAHQHYFMRHMREEMLLMTLAARPCRSLLQASHMLPHGSCTSPQYH